MAELHGKKGTPCPPGPRVLPTCVRACVRPLLLAYKARKRELVSSMRFSYFSSKGCGVEWSGVGWDGDGKGGMVGIVVWVWFLRGVYVNVHVDGCTLECEFYAGLSCTVEGGMGFFRVGGK